MSAQSQARRSEQARKARHNVRVQWPRTKQFMQPILNWKQIFALGKPSGIDNYARLAERVGVTRSYVSGLKNGQIEVQMWFVLCVKYLLRCRWDDILIDPFSTGNMTAREALGIDKLPDGRPWPGTPAEIPCWDDPEKQKKYIENMKNMVDMPPQSRTK